MNIELPCQFEIEVEYDWERELEYKEACTRAHILFDGEVIWTSLWQFGRPYHADGDEISDAKNFARDRLIERLKGLLA